MNFILLLMLCTSQLYSASLDVQEKTGQAETKNLLDRFKPTADWCRAAIRMGPSGEPETVKDIISATDMGAFICMTGGFKKVASITGYSFELMFLEKGPIDTIDRNTWIRLTDWESMANYNNISFIKTTYQTPVRWVPLSVSYTLYTPEGKVDALLLVKWQELLQNRQQNEYLVGLLLGYQERDIEAFYKKNEKSYLADQKEALDWITKNKDGIEKWIEDNKEKYGIVRGNFKNPINIEVSEKKQ